MPSHTNVISIADFVNQKDKLTPICCNKHSGQPLVLICKLCLDKFCVDCDGTDGRCHGGPSSVGE